MLKRFASHHHLLHLGLFRNLFFLGILPLFLISIPIIYVHIHPPLVLADSDCTCSNPGDDKSCNLEKEACLKDKISQTQSQANTLNGTISILNSQIQVQEIQIKQTKLEITQLENDIQDLSSRISGLNISLDSLTANLVDQVDENYERRLSDPFQLMLLSNSLSDFLTKYKYLQIVEEHTAQLMQEAENQRLTYDQEKQLKQQKQDEVNKKKQDLQDQEQQLQQDRADKQTLLTQTKNDEARYQKELEQTLAEQQALQSIIAGKGNESEVGSVSQGQQIATIIPGPSPCSNGAHLHFEVVRNGDNFNPASFLKPLSGLIWSNDPDTPFDFTGSWDWPLNNAARINQGYGMTWYARVRRAYGGGPHTGIDMVSKTPGDLTVKAVKDGVLYRGMIHCGGGMLHYVKVQHKDSDISTFYLHVNY